MSPELQTLIGSLLSYQKLLVRLAREHPAAAMKRETSLLATLPRYGTLADRDTIWGFSKHGLGIRYIDIRSLMCVDFEIEPDDPSCLSKWRLRLFAESVGTSEAVLAEVDNIKPGPGIRLSGDDPSLFQWVGPN